MSEIGESDCMIICTLGWPFHRRAVKKFATSQFSFSTSFAEAQNGGGIKTSGFSRPMTMLKKLGREMKEELMTQEHKLLF